MFIRTVTCAALASFLMLTLPALGASEQDWNDCTSDDLDRRIRGCTRVLQDSRELPRNRAGAFLNRGIAWKRKGELDRALNDYNEAIRIDPKYTTIYYYRGIVFHDKGAFDRAIADYSEAIRLEPKFAAAYAEIGR